MHCREILGAADVPEETLTRLVAKLLGEPLERVTVVRSKAERVTYDLASLTTAGRYWVSGQAMVAGSPRSFCFFVKHVQSWSRSPLFGEVPPEQAAMAEASVPWRTEPLVYRSDLVNRLPDGLRMPRPIGVFDIDDKSASVWMERVPALHVEWDESRFSRAGYLLGRLAASPRVRVCAGIGGIDRIVDLYVHGRVLNQVLPRLRDPEIWKHPLVAGAFDASLCVQLTDCDEHAVEIGDERGSLPLVTLHGDACPNKMLVTAEHDGFSLIDYGFFGKGPIGFDLGQLLVGDVQIGRGPAARLQAIDAAILSSYVEGLRAEGCQVSREIVRRAHALHLMLFTGLSCLPIEHLGSEQTPALRRIASERAAVARFSLELLRTSPPVTPKAYGI